MLELLTVQDFIGFTERFSEDFCAVVQDVDKIKEAFSFVSVICFTSWLGHVLQIQNYCGADI